MKTSGTTIALGVAAAAVIIFFIAKNKASAQTASAETAAGQKNILDSLPKTIINIADIQKAAGALVSTYNTAKIFSDNQIKNIVFKIIKVESNYRNIAGADGKSIGMMQLLLATAQNILNRSNLTSSELLNDTVLNLTAGIKYFIHQINRYKNINSAIIAYHCGSDPNVSPSLFKNLAFSKTEAASYLAKVLKA